MVLLWRPKKQRFLDSGRLLQSAKGQALLEDFGSGDFRPRVDSAVRTLNALLAQNAGGVDDPLDRKGLSEDLVRLLTTRLRLRDWEKKNAAVFAERLPATILLLGLPDSGVEVIAKALSTRPGFVVPSEQDAHDPVPSGQPPWGSVEPVSLERLAACDFPLPVWQRVGARSTATDTGVLVPFPWGWSIRSLQAIAARADGTSTVVVHSTAAMTSLPDVVGRLGEVTIVSVDAPESVDGPVGAITGLRPHASTTPRALTSSESLACSHAVEAFLASAACAAHRIEGLGVGRSSSDLVADFDAATGVREGWSGTI